jgi:hypothetical protein
MAKLFKKAVSAVSSIFSPAAPSMMSGPSTILQQLAPKAQRMPTYGDDRQSLLAARRRRAGRKGRASTIMSDLTEAESEGSSVGSSGVKLGA